MDEAHLLEHGGLALVEQLVDLFFDLGGELAIDFFVLLLGEDGLLTGHLHLDLLHLDVLNLLNLVLLDHLLLPAGELARILEPHRHLVHFGGLQFLFFVEEGLLTLECRHIKLHVGLPRRVVRHLAGLKLVKFETCLDLFTFALDELRQNI